MDKEKIKFDEYFVPKGVTLEEILEEVREVKRQNAKSPEKPESKPGTDSVDTILAETSIHSGPQVHKDVFEDYYSESPPGTDEETDGEEKFISRAEKKIKYHEKKAAKSFKFEQEDESPFLKEIKSQSKITIPRSEPLQKSGIFAKKPAADQAKGGEPEEDGVQKILRPAEEEPKEAGISGKAAGKTDREQGQTVKTVPPERERLNKVQYTNSGFVPITREEIIGNKAGIQKPEEKKPDEPEKTGEKQMEDVFSHSKETSGVLDDANTGLEGNPGEKGHKGPGVFQTEIKSDMISFEAEDEPEEKAFKIPFFKGRKTKALEPEVNHELQRLRSVVSYEEEEQKESFKLPYGLLEYDNPADSPRIRLKLLKIKRSYVLTSVLIAVIACFSIAVSLLPLINISLPKGVDPAAHPSGFLILQIILTGLSLIVCYKEVLSGFSAVLKGGFNQESTAAVGVFITLFYNISLLSGPVIADKGKIFIYSPVFLFGLFLCVLSRYLNISRIYDNFVFITREGNRHATFPVLEDAVIDLVEQDFSIDNALVLGNRQAAFFNRFFELSFKDGITERTVGRLAPVTVAGALVAFLALLVTGKAFSEAFSGFIAVFAVSAPVLIGFSLSFQLYLASKSHRKSGVVVSGAPAVEEFGEVDSVVIGARDLFKEDSVTLQGIKLFEKTAVNNVIIYGAAATLAAESPLAPMFLKVIEERTEYLPKIESLIYKDKMGLVCQTDGRTVLIGNRNLLERYDVDVPSEEYEARAHRMNRDIVYIAIDGRLSAMIAVSYRFDQETVHRMKGTNSLGVCFAVTTSDPNITPMMIEKGLGLDSGSVTVMPSKIKAQYIFAAAKREPLDAEMIHNGSFHAYINSVSGVIKLFSNIKAMRIFQISAVILGLVSSGFIALHSGTGMLSFDKILAFHLSVFIFSVLFPVLNKS